VHELHDTVPVADVNVPAAHSAQIAVPSPLYLPGGTQKQSKSEKRGKNNEQAAPFALPSFACSRVDKLTWDTGNTAADVCLAEQRLLRASRAR